MKTNKALSTHNLTSDVKILGGEDSVKQITKTNKQIKTYSDFRDKKDIS